MSYAPAGLGITPKPTTKQMPADKVCRPFWIFPLTMEELGYELIKDEEGYLKYQNKAGADSYTAMRWKSGSHYGKMAKGKRFIYFNTTFNPKDDEIFMAIKEDGDTRTVYNGIVRSREEMVLILNSVR